VALSQKLEDFIVVIIMPLFFTNSGLRTDFGLLKEARHWGLALFLVVFATVAKGVSIFIPVSRHLFSWARPMAVFVFLL
jgi:Kef-type K+ transport system membrane component KefB